LPALDNVAVHATFAQMPAGMFRDFGPVGFGSDPALWTMSLEVTFYVILPFVATWYFRRPLIGLLIAAVITAIWQEALVHWSTTEALLGHPSPEESARLQLYGASQFPFYAFSFGAGMAGAWAYVRLREQYHPTEIARRVAWVQLAATLSLAAFCFLLGHADTGQGVLDRNSPLLSLGFTATLTALMVATALGAMRWQRPFAHPFARWLGDISYGIFLIHVVIITYAVRLLFEHSNTLAGPFQVVNGDGSFGAFVALAALVLPLTILYGYVSARFLEQPIRRWAHRFGQRAQAAGGVSAAVPTGPRAPEARAGK
jgi:peptidoglycan/LPS O-acetylase OafA/YrhL